MNTSHPVVFDSVSFVYEEGSRPVLQDFSVELPKGVVSLVGQNGTGKSTLLLLAGGRLLPAMGSVQLFGKDTSELNDEAQRNAYASFVYQNMEFETEESIGDLLEFVYAQGSAEKKDPALISTLVKTLELEKSLPRRTQEVSKGELQRTIIAFSLLYGSPLILMDEPIFALEDYQKERTMKFLVQYAQENDISIYYSVHEHEISRKYSDHAMLFSKNGTIKLGPTADVLTRENMEEAYQIPYSMLYRKENLYREVLLKSSRRSTEEEEETE